ncbi:MAG TPA: peptidylprolyl isomerase [Ignavibacteriaceae bacterium]|nr:peptidylprolyl isomerase [Ignavibacteriaceae bacterium]
MKNLSLFFIALVFFLGCKQSQSNGQENSMVSPDSILVAVMKTNMGTIDLELLPDVAPKAVKNFVGLTNQGYYDSLTFHRVINNFMIQGGDPTGTGEGGKSIYGGLFEDEFNQNFKFDSAGVLAMANAGPNTNGSQFFITLAATPWLNFHYTIFGKVISGLDVVQEIGKVPTSSPNDKPIKPVIIEKMTIETRPKQK